MNGAGSRVSPLSQKHPTERNHPLNLDIDERLSNGIFFVTRSVAGSVGYTWVMLQGYLDKLELHRKNGLCGFLLDVRETGRWSLNVLIAERCRSGPRQ